MASIVLTVRTGGVEKTVRFDREVVTVGRASGCGLVLDDEALSRTHCQFERMGNAVYVRDLNSRNGTKARREPVQRTRLQVGDEVQVGNTIIVFEGVETDQVQDGLGLRTIQLLLGRKRKEQPKKRSAEEENRWLRQVLHLARAVVQELDNERILSRIIDTAVDLASAERGFLVVFDGTDLSVEVARNYWRKDIDGAEIEVSRHIVDRVRAEGRGLIVEDASADERFSEFLSVHALKLRSVLSVPLLLEGRVAGVLYLDNRFTRGGFKEEDLEFVEAFAGLAAIALRNSGLFTQERRQRSELEDVVRRQREEILRSREAGGIQSTRLHYTYDGIVARSAAMRRVLAQIDRVVASELPVLLEGPPGTGKEHLAKTIHAQGPRAHLPFLVLASAALPASLAEVELFGHAKGAYTGAVEARPGLLEAADAGTLLISGIDDLALDAQALFLRVLETKEFRRVGETEPRELKARILATSSRSLQTLVREGGFREDLYFRLKGLRIVMPTLADRPEDLEELLTRLLEAEAPGVELSPKIRQELLRRPWPGNLLELRNTVLRLVLHGGQVSSLSELEDLAELTPGQTLKSAVEELERRYLRAALRRVHGNLSQAANELGLSRVGLRKKLRRYGMDREIHGED